MKKLPEKLSHVIHDNPAFKATWNNCIFNTDNTEECDRCWELMVEEYKLHDNRWLQHMFAIRHMWIPTYTKSIFSAGMRTTGRSESINAFFDGFVNYKSSLIDFANGYEKAVQRRREAETEADFKTFYGKPVLKTKFELEQEMASVYTLSVFCIFQKEIEDSMVYIAERVRSEGSKQFWKVFRYTEIDATKRKIICWKSDVQIASCPCMKFESCGIICRHIIALFRFIGVVFMPPSLLLSRWTQTAKAQVRQQEITSTTMPHSDAVRNHILTKDFSILRHAAMRDRNVYEVVKVGLRQLVARIEDTQRDDITTRPSQDGVSVEAGDNFIVSREGLSNMHSAHRGTSSGTMASQASPSFTIMDPNRANTKGRPSKRLKGPLERARGGGRVCRGCNKVVVGHDKRNCPALKEGNQIHLSTDTNDLEK